MSRNCCLTDEEEHSLINAGKLVKFSKGELVFTEGQKAEETYYVLSGWVNVFKMNDRGNQISVGLRYRGQFAGFGGLFDNAYRRFHAQALIDSEIIVLSRKNFQTLTEKLPAIYAKLFYMAVFHLHDLQNDLGYFISNQMHKRLSLTLLNISNFFGYSEGKKIFVNIKIPQEQLAYIVGCSRQTINKLLKEFKNQGYIEMSGRKITVVFPKKLQQYLENEVWGETNIEDSGQF